MPESSAIATRPQLRRAAARALPSAFSAKVSPSSGGSSTSPGARAARRPRPPAARAGARTRGACARCGSPAAARGAAGRPWPAALRAARAPLTRSAGRRRSWRAAIASCLDRAQLLDPRAGERQQLVEVGPGERGALGRGLHLHQPALAGHHDVGVDLGASSPRSSRGRAAGGRRPSPHETAATEPVSGVRSSRPSCCRRAHASASAT